LRFHTGNIVISTDRRGSDIDSSVKEFEAHRSVVIGMNYRYALENHRPLRR